MGFYQRRATNLHRHGDCDATTDYNAVGSGATVSLDTGAFLGVKPNAAKITCDGTTANQGVWAVTATGQAAAAAVNGVGSIRFKGASGQSYRCLLRWENTDASTANGTVVTFNASGASQLLGDALGGVATLSALAVAAGKTGDRLVLRVEIDGTRAESFWVANAMLEKGQSSVARYIPTSGSTKTRPSRFGSGHLLQPHLAR